MIPCTDTCRWQRSGECTLDTCENPTGQPARTTPVCITSRSFALGQQPQRPGNICHRQQLQSRRCFQVLCPMCRDHTLCKA